MPGKRARGITARRRPVYEALRRQGMAKSRAARIANAGKTLKGRRAMARKAARTRSKER